MNTPYVKQTEVIDGKIVITNPITSDNPYLHSFPSKAQTKAEEKYINVYRRGFGWNRILRSKYYNNNFTEYKNKEESLAYSIAKETLKLVNAEIKLIETSLTTSDVRKLNSESTISVEAHRAYNAGYTDYHKYLQFINSQIQE